MSQPWCLLISALLTYILTIYGKDTVKTTPEPEPSTKDIQDRSEIDNTLIMSECNETFRTEMSYIESLNKTGSFPDETDRTPKCFVRCMLKKTNVVSEDGVFDQEQALAFFASQRPDATVDNFRNSTDTCSARNETCMCERSYNFVKCVVELELKKLDIFAS